MILVEERELNNEDGRRVWQALSMPEAIPMEFGDYLIKGHQITALVERVTANGLLGDIETGRITEKLQGCASEADLVFLVIEGDFPVESLWNAEAIEHFCLSASLRWCHYICDTMGPEQSGKAILGWDRYLNKEKHDLHLARTRPFTMGKGDVSTGAYILSGFPGVGVTKAQSIMEYCEKIPLAWIISARELAQVPGFGKKSARKLWEVLR